MFMKNIYISIKQIIIVKLKILKKKWWIYYNLYETHIEFKIFIFIHITQNI